MKHHSNATTNILLGIIAAEVIFLTVEAFADRWRNPWPPEQQPVRIPNEDGEQADTPEEQLEENYLKGSMQGIADKLKNPAWAGVLAANEGNISLADAERAVPMPNTAQFVGRLDRNPFVGRGMKDRSRD